MNEHFSNMQCGMGYKIHLCNVIVELEWVEKVGRLEAAIPGDDMMTTHFLHATLLPTFSPCH